MADNNHHHGEVRITIAGKSYSLLFDHNALADLEGELNIVLGTQEGNPFALGYRGMRALLWAGLRHQMPRLTVQQAGELLEEADLDSLAEPLGHAFALKHMTEEKYQDLRAQEATQEESPKNSASPLPT